MNRDEHARLTALFHQAIDLDDRSRADMLARLERSDAALATRLRRLLSFASITSPNHSDPPPLDESGNDGGQAAAEPGAVCESAVIGPFRLDERLDAGGPNEVFSATRIKPPHDRVAIKLLSRGAVSAEARWRFESECAAMAAIVHPNVAQLHDIGTIADGRPWLAIELVQGVDLVTHCRANQLDNRAMVALMATVCDAVQAIHQRGVLHRDLKPSNVLVARDACSDAPRDTPKLIDFGLARLLPLQVGDLASTARASGENGSPQKPRSAMDGPACDAAPACDRVESCATPHTATGQLIGTLPYMSPESLGGDPRLIDGRTDIYSLGVILFELLAGRRPFALASLPVPRRLTADSLPPDLGAAQPACRGDLARITAKAMAFDRAHRYQSAGELGAELRRWLRHEPVSARPPSIAHSVALFVRRQPWIAVAAVVLLTAAVVVAAALVRDVHRSREALAESQRLLIFAVAELLPIVEKIPGGSTAQDSVLGFVLDATEPGGRFSDDPLTRWLRARALLGQTYRDPPGDRDLSERRLQEAFRIVDDLEVLRLADVAALSDESAAGATPDDPSDARPRPSAAPDAATSLPSLLELRLLRTTLLVRCGNLAQERGELATMLAMQAAARALLEELSVSHPRSAKVHSQLAFLHAQDASIELDRRAFAAALTSLDRMEHALDQLAEITPQGGSQDHGRVTLAMLRASAVLMRRDVARGDLETAHRENQLAIEIATCRIRRQQPDRAAREDLIRATTQGVEIALALGRLDDALDLLRNLLPHAEWLYAVDAGGPTRALLLGDVHDRMGEIHLRRNEPARALECLDVAKAHLDRIRAEATAFPFDPTRLGRCEWLRADALNRLQRHDEARAAWQRVVDLFREAVMLKPSSENLARLALTHASTPAGLAVDEAEMLASASRAVDMDASDASAWEANFLALHRAGRTRDALAAGQRALDLAGGRDTLIGGRVQELLSTLEVESAEGLE